MKDDTVIKPVGPIIIIGHYLPHTMPGGGFSVFHVHLMNGFRRGAHKYGFEIDDNSSAIQPRPDVAILNQAAGLIVIFGNEHEIIPPKQNTVPVVYIFNAPPGVDAVKVDDFSGGRRLGEHLAAMGHRRVAFMGPDTQLAHTRLAGLRAGLEPAGAACPPDVVQLRESVGGQEPENIDILLAGETRREVLRRRFTAIACYNDWFATHAIQRMNEHGIRVPEDISITGFDNAVFIGYKGPELATCAIPLEDFGETAVNLIAQRIKKPGSETQTVMIEPELVKGRSVKSESSDTPA